MTTDPSPNPLPNESKKYSYESVQSNVANNIPSTPLIVAQMRPYQRKRIQEIREKEEKEKAKAESQRINSCMTMMQKFNKDFILGLDGDGSFVSGEYITCIPEITGLG